MDRIFMIGYMGSGKTTVGKRLAESLSLSFIDLDAYIEKKYRKTISMLFEEREEQGFRILEHQALQEVAQFEDVVVSTGGGTPCFFDNMEVMNRVGTTIYLDVQPEDLAENLLKSKSVRPLINGKPKEELIPFITGHLATREYYYRKARIIYPVNHLIPAREIYLIVQGIEKQLKR